MQKTLDILEKNVQWIVLGLAALFLLWVAYAYVLTPPATVKINNRIATPADAALVTQDEAKQLDQQIKESRSVNFPTDDLVTAWEKHIQDPFIAMISNPDWTGSFAQIDTGPKDRRDNPNGLPRIAELPVWPKPQLLPPTAGLSTVSLQAPDAAQNGNAQAAAQQTKDTDWINISAVIQAAALRDSLKAPLKGATIDPALYNTSLLEVVLERQESNGVDANGAPTFPADDKGTTIVPALSIYQPTLQKVPADSASKDAQYQFLRWAQQNPSLVSAPVFNQVTAGDPWQTPQLPAATPDSATPPGTPTTPASVPATGAPDPSAVPAGPVPSGNPPANLPPGSPPATPTPAPTTPVAPPAAAGMKYPGNASYAPLDPSRPPDSPYPGGRRSRRDYFPPGFNPANNPGINPGNGAGPGPDNAAVIDTVNLTNDLLIWATDETVKPGKTYRYRISYKLKNPVFDVKNLAPDALVKQFLITSPPSDWTDAVKARPVAKFWLAKVAQNHAFLDVFQYQAGTWKTMKNMAANPGDQVPGTDLTLVDIRPSEASHGGDHYVLLTSDTGDMQRRDLATDQKDSDHALMLDPTGAGAGTAPPQPPPNFRPPPGRPGRGRSGSGSPSAFR